MSTASLVLLGCFVAPMLLFLLASSASLAFVLARHEGLNAHHQ